jgi:cysteine desulfurase
VLDKAGSKALLHVDASQLPFAESFEHTRLGADFIVLDAQKVGGVRGVGALIMPKPVPLTPTAHGGGQEDELRPGTEPVALIAAFSAALTDGEDKRDAFITRAKGMRADFVSTIAGAIPDVVVNEGKENVPHILNLSFPGRDTDYAVMLLDAKGVAVSTKSTCETDSNEGSRAVLAYTADEARARSTLRISWGPETTGKELEQLGKALIDTIRFLDANTLY